MSRRANRQADQAADATAAQEKCSSNGLQEEAGAKVSSASSAAAADAAAVPKWLQLWWLPVGLTFLCYSPNLLIHAGDDVAWIYDDHSSVRGNPCVSGVDSLDRPVPWSCVFWVDYWGTPLTSNISHKSYRPVTTAFFIAERALWGFFDARLWHLGNVATKALATWLFGHVARRCLIGADSATYATLLFAVHPIHTESVSNITGQAETLSAVFMLLAFLAYSGLAGRPRAVRFAASVGAALLATLCKEPGFAALAVICVHIVSLEVRAVKQDGGSGSGGGSSRRLCWRDLGRARPAAWLQLAGYCAAGGLIFAWRCWVQGERPQFSSFMNPGGFHPSRLARGLTMAYYAVTHASLLLAPVTLCPDYSNSAIPELESLLDQRCLWIWAAAAGLAWAAVALARAAVDRRRDVHELVTCCAWLVLPFLPVSNLFFVVGFAVAERVLFAPSIGLCLLAGLGVRRLTEAVSQSAPDRARPRLQRCLHRSLQGLLLLLAARTALRDLDWNNGRSLWTSAYKACAPNANVLANLAIAEEGKPAFQHFLFERATAVGLPFVSDHSVESLAQLLNRHERHREMLELCQRYAHLGHARNAMCTGTAKMQLRMYAKAARDFGRVYSQMERELETWHLTRIGIPDIVKSYARCLAMSGSDRAASLISKHEAAMPPPVRSHLLVSSALLAAAQNRTADVADAIARLARLPDPGPALTDLAKDLQELRLHAVVLRALAALPEAAREHEPLAAFLRQAAQDGLYIESAECATKEQKLLASLTGLDPVAALEALAAAAEAAVRKDAADLDHSLLHVCRLIVQPVDAVLAVAAETSLASAPGLVERLTDLRDLFADGGRGELLVHPNLLLRRDRRDSLLADLGLTARLMRQADGAAEGGWAGWRMRPVREFATTRGGGGGGGRLAA